jgi:hypothetical protein
MKYFLLAAGTISLLLSFFIKIYFIQFLAIGIMMLAFVLLGNYLTEMGEFKALLKQHMELVKKDIEEINK